MMARTHDQFIEDVAKRNSANPGFEIKIKRGSKYESLDKEMIFTCCNGHPDFSTKPRYIIQKGSGCPACRAAKIQQSTNTGLDKFTIQLAAINPSVYLYPHTQKYTNTNTKMSFKCAQGHTFKTLPKVLLTGHTCPLCAKKSSISHPQNVYYASEADVSEFNQLVSNIPHMCIELIPIKTSYDKYIYTKRLLSATKPTIFIYEDEWTDNKTLIRSKLMHYAHSNSAPLIHARKCVIKQITASEKRTLLDANHVQGNDTCNLAYGAFFEDELVALMSFSSPRVAMGAKNKDRTSYEGIWELSRFCTDTKYRIPGIASRLLSHFKRNHVWREIYSYADKRWSVGNMYHQLGFTLVADNAPSYFYVVDGKRKHRWNYRKDILKKTLPGFRNDLTEGENMTNHGYWRVWDCGTLKFLMIR